NGTGIGLRIGSDPFLTSPMNGGDTVQIGVAVPGPIAGAGLPGLIAACGGLLALARPRLKIASFALGDARSGRVLVDHPADSACHLGLAANSETRYNSHHSGFPE